MDWKDWVTYASDIVGDHEDWDSAWHADNCTGYQHPDNFSDCWDEDYYYDQDQDQDYIETSWTPDSLDLVLDSRQERNAAYEHVDQGRINIQEGHQDHTRRRVSYDDIPNQD